MALALFQTAHRSLSVRPRLMDNDAKRSSWPEKVYVCTWFCVCVYGVQTCGWKQSPGFYQTIWNCIKVWFKFMLFLQCQPYPPSHWPAMASQVDLDRLLHASLRKSSVVSHDRSAGVCLSLCWSPNRKTIWLPICSIEASFDRSTIWLIACSRHERLIESFESSLDHSMHRSPNGYHLTYTMHLQSTSLLIRTTIYNFSLTSFQKTDNSWWEAWSLRWQIEQMILLCMKVLPALSSVLIRGLLSQSFGPSHCPFKMKSITWYLKARTHSWKTSSGSANLHQYAQMKTSIVLRCIKPALCPIAELAWQGLPPPSPHRLYLYLLDSLGEKGQFFKHL